MPILRSQNAAVLMKLEVSEGTFLPPSSSTDGILGENLSLDLNPQNIETDEWTGSLDSRGPIVGGLQCAIGFEIYLKGNGIPGVAPEWDEVMQVCSWGKTEMKTDVTGVTISVTGTNTIADSANGLAAFTVGTQIWFSSPGNPGVDLLVATSAAGSLTVTKPDGSAPGLTNEAAGGSATVRRGIAGVSAAAGTTTGFTAAAPWGNSDQLYRGLPVLLSGNPATPALSFISDYLTTRVAQISDLMGVALSASTKISIPANVLYKPISSAIPSASIETYIDGVKYQFAGCRGNISFSFTAAGAVKASVRLTGMFVGKSDAAVPTPTYDGTRPGIFRNSPMLVNRQATALRELTLETGAAPEYPADPNQVEGFSPPLITDRNMSGSMNPYAQLVATRNIFADFRAGNPALIHARVMGGAASNPGQRIGLTIPQAFHTGYKPGQDGKLATEEVQFFPRGQDAGALLCLY